MLLANLLVFNFSLASTADTVIDGLANTGIQAGYPVASDGKPQQSFTQAFATYAVGLATILSGLCVVLMIYAGWLWMTAQGKEEQVMKAKKIMLGAVIGLAIIISARLIAELAFNVLKCTIPGSQNNPNCQVK